MKRLIIFIALLMAASLHINAKGLFMEEVHSASMINQIKNGWYTATVNYSNYNRDIHAIYRFNVRVESDIVTAIDLGIGNYIHSGNNDSGYLYYGGILSFERDNSNTIVAASTTVIITEENGNIIRCDIQIEG